MPIVVKDRVRETTSTVGTGQLTLSGAVNGYQAFSSIGNGNSTYYCIYEPIAGTWEVGIGTYSSTGNTLSRDTVLASSNGGALVNFAANIKDVFITYPASQAVIGNATNGQIPIGNGSGYTLNTLTQGAGIAINNSSGSITIANSQPMIYPAAGIPNSTGVAWATPYTVSGTGTVVALATSPTFVTPTLGVATATSINRVTLTAPATGSTLTIADGKTLTASNSLTLVGTDATTITFPTANTRVPQASQTLTFSGPTAARTYTLPDTTATLAALGVAQSFTATQTFNGSSAVLAASLLNAGEVVTVSATAATGTINYDVTTQSVVFFTANAAANWIINFRGSAGTTLNTLLAIGQSVTVVHMVTQGATAFYNTTIQVDGATAGVTTRWQGGTAPTSGNASSLDVYSYTIVKTASATFTVLASQTRFA